MIKFADKIKNSKALQSFIKDAEQNRNAHGYLLICDDNLTLNQALMILGQAILCKTKNACGKCIECLRVEQGNHTNISVLSATASKGSSKESIKAEDIGNLIGNSFITALEDGKKVFIVQDSNKMTESAQNKLLKTLEEPSKDVVLLLGSTTEAGILQTIKSRCVKIYLNIWDEKSILEELDTQYPDIPLHNKQIACEMAGGKIEYALELLQNSQMLELYTRITNMLLNLKNSANVSDFLGCFGKDNNAILCSLNLLEGIVGKVITEHTTKKLSELSKIYSLSAVVNIYQLILKAKEKVNFNANIGAVEYDVLMGILEIKFKTS